MTRDESLPQIDQELSLLMRRLASTKKEVEEGIPGAEEKLSLLKQVYQSRRPADMNRGASPAQRMIVASAKGPGAKLDAWRKWYPGAQYHKDDQGRKTGRFILQDETGRKFIDDPEGIGSWKDLAGEISQQGKIFAQVLGGGVGGVLAGGSTMGLGTLAGVAGGEMIAGEAYDQFIQAVSGADEKRSPGQYVADVSAEGAAAFLAPPIFQKAIGAVANIPSRVLDKTNKGAKEIVKTGQKYGMTMAPGLYNEGVKSIEAGLSSLMGGRKVLERQYDLLANQIQDMAHTGFTMLDPRNKRYLQDEIEAGGEIKTRLQSEMAASDSKVNQHMAGIGRKVDDVAQTSFGVKGAQPGSIPAMSNNEFGQVVKERLKTKADEIDEQESILWGDVEDAMGGENIAIPNFNAAVSRLSNQSTNSILSGILTTPATKQFGRLSPVQKDPTGGKFDFSGRGRNKPWFEKMVSQPEMPSTVDWKGLHNLRSTFSAAARGEASSGLVGKDVITSRERKQLMGALTNDMKEATDKVPGATGKWEAARLYSLNNNTLLNQLQETLINHNDTAAPGDVYNAWNKNLASDPDTYDKGIGFLFDKDQMPAIKGRRLYEMGSPKAEDNLKSALTFSSGFNPVSFQRNMDTMDNRSRDVLMAPFKNEVKQLDALTNDIANLDETLGTQKLGSTQDAKKVSSQLKKIRDTGKKTNTPLKDIVTDEIDADVNRSVLMNNLDTTVMGGNPSIAPGDVKNNMNTLLSKDPEMYEQALKVAYPNQNDRMAWKGRELYDMGVFSSGGSNNPGLYNRYVDNALNQRGRGEFSSVDYQRNLGKLSPSSQRVLTEGREGITADVDVMTKAAQRRGGGADNKIQTDSPDAAKLGTSMNWTLGMMSAPVIASGLLTGAFSPATIGTAMTMAAAHPASGRIASQLTSPTIRKIAESSALESQGKGILGRILEDQGIIEKTTGGASVLKSPDFKRPPAQKYEVTDEAALTFMNPLGLEVGKQAQDDYLDSPRNVYNRTETRKEKERREREEMYRNSRLMPAMGLLR